MQRISSILFIILLAAFILSACGAQTTQAPPTTAPTQTIQPGRGITSEERELPLTDAEVPRVSLEEAKAALDSGAAILVDVRSPDAFEASHAVGAISVPLGEIERNITGLPLEKDQWIITYCTWQNEHQSARAAFLLLHNGYPRVDALLGGFAAWVEAGLPIEP